MNQSWRLALITSGLVLALSSCASAPTESGAGTNTAANDARCKVTGSNLPKRDCRSDVTVLPADAVDSLQPRSGNAPRN